MRKFIWKLTRSNSQHQRNLETLRMAISKCIKSVNELEIATLYRKKESWNKIEEAEKKWESLMRQVPLCDRMELIEIYNSFYWEYASIVDREQDIKYERNATIKRLQMESLRYSDEFYAMLTKFDLQTVKYDKLKHPRQRDKTLPSSISAPQISPEYSREIEMQESIIKEFDGLSVEENDISSENQIGATELLIQCMRESIKWLKRVYPDITKGPHAYKLSQLEKKINKAYIRKDKAILLFNDLLHLNDNIHDHNIHLSSTMYWWLHELRNAMRMGYETQQYMIHGSDMKEINDQSPPHAGARPKKYNETCIKKSRFSRDRESDTFFQTMSDINHDRMPPEGGSQESLDKGPWTRQDLGIDTEEIHDSRIENPISIIDFNAYLISSKRSNERKPESRGYKRSGHGSEDSHRNQSARKLNTSNKDSTKTRSI